MKRRDLIKGALMGGAAVGIAGLPGCAGDGSSTASAGGPAVHTGKNVRWKMASSFPRSLDTIFGSAEVLAERVAAMTDGAFQIRVHPAGEIVPAMSVMDAVQQATVQAGHTASYYYTGKNRALAFDTCVPFGMSARQQTAWLEEMGGRELMSGLFADFGIVTLGAGNTGAQMGGWFRNEIDGLADLRGLKFRIPGMGGEVMNRLGASVQVLAGGEIYPALERGAIDATEWVGPYDDEKLGFHRVAKYYYSPGWWEPGPSLSFHINQKEWDALPTTYREIFRTAAREAAAVMQERYDARNPPALQRLIDSGVQLRRFSSELMVGAREASQQMLEEHAAADPTFKKILDHWQSARSAAFRWFATAELDYAEFAFRS